MEDADEELDRQLCRISGYRLRSYLAVDLEPRPDCCMYEVPKCLREANENAYTPQVVSIGPIHGHNDKYLRMERQKLIYLKKICERTSIQTLKDFFSFIEENFERIKMCYDAFLFDTLLQKLGREQEFPRMVFRDAVFIIELFLKHSETRDFFVKGDWLRIELCMDLILLENQLPFFVLEYLFNLVSVSSDRTPFLQVTCDYFNFFNLFGYLSYEYLSYETHGENLEIKHFTDLVWRSVVRYRPTDTYSLEEVKKVYSATMLHEAGVGFKATEGTSLLLDVRFEKGELQIPTFKMWHRAEAFIRNLMALEQCHYQGKAYVCSYIQLLDYLVDTDKDVDLLVKKGIFLNGMGSSAAVANMINTLMVGVARVPPYYNEIAKDLNQHYDNSWNRTKATLRQVYFSNLLRGTATVAAFIVVLLTLIQTVLAILERALPTK